MASAGVGVGCWLEARCALTPASPSPRRVAPLPAAPAQVWEAACGADSPLLSPATASKLAADDAGAAAEAAEVLLTQHARHLGGESSGAAIAAARSLALLLLHPAAAPREAAAAAAATVSAASPELAANLVAGLQHWASNPGAPEVAAVLGDAASPLHRFAAAAEAAAPAAGTVQLSAPLVSALLLLAHHPSVAGPAGSGAAWAAMARKLGPVGEVLASSPADVAAALVSSAATGAACPEPAQQAAACGALRAAMALAPAPLFEALMTALAPLLATGPHDALTARETKIYFTPAGEQLDPFAPACSEGHGGQGGRAQSRGRAKAGSSNHACFPGLASNLLLRSL